MHMHPDTLRFVHLIQNDLDTLWINAEYGSERRATLNEVRALVENHVMTAIKKDRKNDK